MKANFKKSLSAATCLLLGVNPASHASDGDNKATVSFLSYSEANGVSVIAPQLTASSKINDDNSISANIIYDTVTGSSPTGEVPSGSIQTVTSTSGKTSTILATTKPQKTFNDKRTALSLGWQHTIGRLLKLSATLNSSTENDYKSDGLSLNLAKDTQNRLTTWNVGVAYSSDKISGTDKLDGVGGIPRVLTNSLNKERQSQLEHKQSRELKIGVTQVLSKKSLMLLSYTKSLSEGYHNDPYKLVSVVDSSGTSLATLYESRPATRSRDIVFAQYIANIRGNVLNLSYRYFSDDWNIVSHTLGIKYRLMLGRHFSIEPHLRLYSQSAASFHHYYLEESSLGNLPQHISADSRLAAFSSYTYGLKSILSIKNIELSGRLEAMSQYSNQDTRFAPGKLSQYNLFSNRDVIIISGAVSIVF